jgi:AsmA-like C-terminal region
VQDDGEILRDIRLQAAIGADRPMLAVITPNQAGRSVTVTAADAGALLRAIDAANSIGGGRLAVFGQFLDGQIDSTGGRPLSGRVEMDDFHVLKGAGFGKVLQALTVYGLADAMKGPGLSFSRLVAPFEWRDGVLRVSDARAFSPSLGLTGTGTVDFDTGTVDMNGTIVPAYFFNSLLGRVPVIGRLFSPERGGGLIAASYSVTGRLDDPAVRVNPLTALAPGFIREMFGGLRAAGKALEPQGDLGMMSGDRGPGQH